LYIPPLCGSSIFDSLSGIKTYAMCFSAPASFIASAGLLVIGAVAIKRCKTRPQAVLAAIPVIFGIQQFSEGLLWLSLSSPEYASWHNASMYAFLFFAQVVWPTYVPLGILLLEEQPLRKKILVVFLSLGVFISAYLLYCLFLYKVTAAIIDHHIYYELNFPLANRWFSGLIYLLAAVVSPFISGFKRLRLLGLILLGSYLFTRIFYQDYLISVWCYFAAVLSIMILAIINNLRKQSGRTI
jgi:hypothetical protein